MKCLFLIPVFLLLGMIAVGQLKVIGQSPVWGEEDNEGIQRVALMKNGQTVYLRLSKASLVVRIYSPKFTVKANRQLTPRLGKASSFKIKGVYDMNGDIVLLVSAVDDHQVVMQRVVIDGRNGAMKSLEKIGELERVSYFKLAGTAFGDVPVPDFFSEELPEGNGYAVVAMNSFQPDRNKRIVVSIYGADNKELCRAFYHSPDDRYKYLQYLGMAPMEKDKLGVLAYGYNTASSGGKECELLYGTLTTGDTILAIDKFGTSGKASSFAVTAYNPLSKKMMLVEKVNKEGYTATVVDPYNKTSTTKMKMNREKDDIPRNVYANEDGTFSIVYEDYTETSVLNGNHMHTTTRMEDYTVSVIGTDGKQEIAHYTAPRRHKRSSDVGWSRAELQSYLSAGANNYLLLNDDMDNIEKAQEGKKLSVVKSLDDCDGFYYNLSGQNEVPKADFLFGKPDEKRAHNLGYFVANDYRKDIGMYVVLKKEQRGKDMNWRMVWMKP